MYDPWSLSEMVDKATGEEAGDDVSPLSDTPQGKRETPPAGSATEKMVLPWSNTRLGLGEPSNGTANNSTVKHVGVCPHGLLTARGARVRKQQRPDAKGGGAPEDPRGGALFPVREWPRSGGRKLSLTDREKLTTMTRCGRRIVFGFGLPLSPLSFVSGEGELAGEEDPHHRLRTKKCS